MDSIILPELPTFVGAPNLAGFLSLAITFLLPLIAALFMKASWTPFQKGVALFAVAAVKAFLEAWLGAVVEKTAFDFVGAAYSTVVQFGMAVVFYVGLLKRSAVQQAALNSGVKDRP